MKLHWHNMFCFNLNLSAATTDLMWVLLHELGHSLGFTHSDDTTSVMYPYYQGYKAIVQLNAFDTAIRNAVYGKHFFSNLIIRFHGTDSGQSHLADRMLYLNNITFDIRGKWSSTCSSAHTGSYNDYHTGSHTGTNTGTQNNPHTRTKPSTSKVMFLQYIFLFGKAMRKSGTLISIGFLKDIYIIFILGIHISSWLDLCVYTVVVSFNKN